MFRIALPKKNIYFLLAYSIYYFGMVFSMTSAPGAMLIKYAAILSSAVILGLRFLFLVRTGGGLKKGMLLLTILLLLIVSIAVISKDFFVLMIVLLGVNTAFLDRSTLKGVLKLSIFISALVSIVAIIACYAGLIPNINTPRGYNTAPRYAWGFTHSQVFSLILLYAILCYYALRKKVRLLDFVVFQGLTLVVAKVFDAKNALIAMEIFYMVYFGGLIIRTIFLRKVGNSRRPLEVAAYWSAFLMSLISVILLVLYDRGNSFAMAADQFLTQRIRLSHMTFSVTPVKLLSIMSFDEYSAMIKATVDNGFYYLILRYGVLYLLLFCGVFACIGRYYSKENNMAGCAAIIAIAASIFISNSITNCYFTPFWVVGLYEAYRLWEAFPQKYRIHSEQYAMQRMMSGSEEGAVSE